MLSSVVDESSSFSGRSRRWSSWMSSLSEVLSRFLVVVPMPVVEESVAAAEEKQGRMHRQRTSILVMVS